MEIPEENIEQSTETEWAHLEQSAAAVDGVLSPEIQSTEIAESEPEIETGQLVAQAIQATADIFAPNWDIQPEESEQLGAAYGALIEKYLPDSGLEKYGVEISAVLITGMILKSRANKPLRKPKPKEIKKEQPEEIASGVLTPKAVANG